MFASLKLGPEMWWRSSAVCTSSSTQSLSSTASAMRSKEEEGRSRSCFTERQVLPSALTEDFKSAPGPETNSAKLTCKQMQAVLSCIGLYFIHICIFHPKSNNIASKSQNYFCYSSKCPFILLLIAVGATIYLLNEVLFHLQIKFVEHFIWQILQLSTKLEPTLIRRACWMFQGWKVKVIVYTWHICT